jgi:hypothetical protein
MKSVARCIGLVSLLLLAVLLSACGKNNEINLIVSQGKVVLNPKPGDHLIWAGGLKVEFLGLTPCTETVPSNECHVKPDLDTTQYVKYYYVCNESACSDPEVDVGSGGPLSHPTAKAASLTDTVTLLCNNNQVQVTPPVLPGGLQSGNIPPKSVVQWFSIGGGSAFIKDWVITFDGGNTSVCNESAIQYGGNTSCTIKSDLAANTYKYAVTSMTCSGAGSGTVKTTQ